MADLTKCQVVQVYIYVYLCENWECERATVGWERPTLYDAICPDCGSDYIGYPRRRIGYKLVHDQRYE